MPVIASATSVSRMRSRVSPLLTAVVLAAWSGCACAAQADGFAIGRAVASLALVVALILVLGVVLRGRGPLGGSAAGGALQIRAQLALGPRERVVVLRVGDEDILLGVSPAGVRALHLLARPLPAAPASGADAGGFAERLRAVLRGGPVR